MEFAKNSIQKVLLTFALCALALVVAFCFSACSDPIGGDATSKSGTTAVKNSIAGFSFKEESAKTEWDSTGTSVTKTYNFTVKTTEDFNVNLSPGKVQGLTWIYTKDTAAENYVKFVPKGVDSATVDKIDYTNASLSITLDGSIKGSEKAALKGVKIAASGETKTLTISGVGGTVTINWVFDVTA